MKRVLAAALVAAIALVAPIAATAETEAVLVVAPDLAPTGTLVTVDLDHWTGSTTVVAELCGNGPEPGSADCDLSTSDGANVVDRRAHLEVRLSEPPSPCPCVIRVRAADGTGPTVSQPVVLTDLAAEPIAEQPAAPPPSTVVVDRVALGDAALAGWFGLPHERTLTFRVRNTGPFMIEEPEVALRVSDGGAPHLVAAPAIPPIAPGEALTVTAEVPVELLVTGDVEVTGQLRGADEAEPFTASTSQQPVGAVLALVAAVALIVVLAVRRRTRRRRARHRSREGAPAAAVEAPADETDETGEIDATGSEPEVQASPIA